MATCEMLEHELREALAHLHDPDYKPSETLCALLGCELQNGALAVQSTLFRAIKSIEPPLTTPPNAFARQIYNLLQNRFVFRLNQEQTAERMHISVSSVQRMQREAVHALARVLWEQTRKLTEGAPTQREGQPLGDEISATQAADWSAQARREMASLMGISGVVSNVGETIAGVLKLKNALAPGRDIRIEIDFLQPNLLAAVHPIVLRQTLITAIGRLAQFTSSGPVTIFARLEDGNVKIAVTGPVATESGISEGDLLRDILVPEDVSIEAHIDASHAFLWVKLPPAEKHTVLVVDDNPDMAHFYQRATTGTCYHTIHITEGRGLLATIKDIEPDVIVLDVMLPDIDGWELLTCIHEDPTTRSIPVIVCSVVREEQLALSLGATLYLLKPVRPREFIRALDQVLSRAAAGASTSPEIPVTAC